MSWFKSWFKECNHEWEKITEKTEEAPMGHLNLTEMKGRGISENILFRTYILVLQCKKCGKLDKTVEKV